MKVVKRDGIEKDYNGNLIFQAVYKAAKSISKKEDDCKSLAEMIKTKVEGSKLLHSEKVSVEDIQNLVEKSLMSSKFKDVATAYIEFRSERDRARENSSDLYKNLEGFLNLTDDTYARENSNKAPEQIVTHRDLIAGIVSKQYAKNIVPKHIMEAHNKGKIHFHDNDYLISTGIHNCGVYDFEYMLANGVTLGDVSIESPKSIGTAANIICQILSKISGSSYGGQSIHEFDKLLRPYALKSLEKLKNKQKIYSLPEEFVQESLKKEIYDACQLVLYQVQTVSSPNGQSSFFSMSLSLSTDPLCKVIKEQYLKCHMNGIGKDHKTPMFPKVLYFVEDGVNLNEGDENYEEFLLALECSSKQMYPDFIMSPNNKKMTGCKTENTTPMGCRSFVPAFIVGGKEKVTGRFNLGVTSVSIPFAALEAEGNKEEFFTSLNDLCELAYEANMLRIERMKGTKAKVSPILWQYGALATLDAEDTIDHLFYNGNATCSIGYAGLYESLEILGDTTKEFAMSVLTFMKEKTDEFTSRSGIAFSIYGTPAESTAYRFARGIKNCFPEYNLGKDYVTNSFHLPVYTDVSMEDKFEWESDFYKVSSGGNVNNIEIPNLSNNLKALEGVVKLAYPKVNYLILNQPVDKCFECGYQGEFVAEVDGFECPTCGNNNPETANVIRRISGYIHNALARPANFGKYSEQKDRVKNL